MTIFIYATLIKKQLINVAKATSYSLLTLCIIFLMMACGGGSNSNTKPTPTSEYSYQLPQVSSDGWEVAHLSDVKMDHTLLVKMMNEVLDNNSGKIDAITIVKNGKLVLDVNIRKQLDYVDEDENNTDISKHYMASVTKSFNSALLGIALAQQPSYSINDPILDFYTQYSSFDNEHQWKYQSSIKNFLTMRHGFAFEESMISGLAENNDDYVKAMLDLAMESEPGSQFAYSSFASIALGDIVAKISHMPTDTFAQTYLFDPLGIPKPKWLKTPVGRLNTGYGLWLSTREMAKLGQLYLQEGEWNGEQLIPTKWVTQSTQQHLELHSIYVADGYGFQWWTKDYTLNGELIETYYADGNGGQFIIVAPQLALVTVFTGHNYNSFFETTGKMEHLMSTYILPSVLNEQ